MSHLLVQILPTPIYRLLSDTWHHSLEYIYSIQKGTNDDEERILSSISPGGIQINVGTNMDPSTLTAIQWGITVGILLVTYLEFYPGVCLS
jgi:hypothetical protein